MRSKWSDFEIKQAIWNIKRKRKHFKIDWRTKCTFTRIKIENWKTVSIYKNWKISIYLIKEEKNQTDVAHVKIWIRAIVKIIMSQKNDDIEFLARNIRNANENEDEALQGARDIIVCIEWIWNIFIRKIYVAYSNESWNFKQRLLKLKKDDEVAQKILPIFRLVRTDFQSAIASFISMCYVLKRKVLKLNVAIEKKKR